MFTVTDIGVLVEKIGCDEYESSSEVAANTHDDGDDGLVFSFQPCFFDEVEESSIVMFGLLLLFFGLGDETLLLMWFGHLSIVMNKIGDIIFVFEIVVVKHHDFVDWVYTF